MSYHRFSSVPCTQSIDGPEARVPGAPPASPQIKKNSRFDANLSQLESLIYLCTSVVQSIQKLHCYQPQRSCGQGNIFTPVCNSVHRGRGVCLSAYWDTTPPSGPGRPNPPQNQTPPPTGQTLPPGPDTTPRTRQTHPPEADSCIRSTSGRYASYWNAFLLPVCLERLMSEFSTR